tara:strand:+ start:342 stop:704 length:363 start_codon:yes stop_codon:yes gene_type:complete
VGVPIPGSLCLFRKQFITFQKVEKINEIDGNEGEFVSHSTPEIEHYETVDGHGNEEKTIEKKNFLLDFFIQYFLMVDPDDHGEYNHILQGLDELKGVVHFPDKRFEKHIYEVFYDLIEQD